MGSWTVVIQGSGPHHNKRKEDINWQAQKFARELKAMGHEIDSVFLTFGGRENVLIEDYIYRREED